MNEKNKVVLSIKNVNKRYKLNKLQTFQALFDINIEFYAGELVSIVGESGSGKSTLMNLIGGLDSNYSGKIIVDNENLRGLNDKQLDKYRKDKVGFIFQSFNLIPHLSILDNVTLALTLSNVNEKEKLERATQMLKKVGLAHEPMIVKIKNLKKDILIIPIGKEISVRIIGKLRPISAPNIPYLKNQESLLSISSSFIKKNFPNFLINGLPPKYPIK